MYCVMIHVYAIGRTQVLPMQIDVTFEHHHSTIHYALLYGLRSITGVTAVSNE